MAYTIAAAKLTRSIDRVIVSTDSEDYARISRHYGAEAPFLRPLEISGDRSPDIEFLRHALEYLHHKENYIPDLIVHLRPTTPMRDPALIDRQLSDFKLDTIASSLRSSHAASVCPYKWFRLDPTGLYNSISTDIKLVETNLPRQSFPSLYIPNGYVDILRHDVVMNSENIHGEAIRAYITEFCHDVDTEEDFKRLEVDLSSHRQDLIDFLDRKGVCL